MKAMILAAGQGKRMRPLTFDTPKPLIRVNGKMLIEYHLEKLAINGFKEVIINVAYLADKIKDTLKDGKKYNLKITYSEEENPLESGGGIIKALPFFNNKPFLVVNADIFTDFNYSNNFNLKDKLAHLILIQNPDHNQKGDFGIDNNKILNSAEKMFTFSGIGYYDPKLFEGYKITKQPLAPILRENIKNNKISADIYDGLCKDIGTPQRLQNIENLIILNNLRKLNNLSC